MENLELYRLRKLVQDGNVGVPTDILYNIENLPIFLVIEELLYKYYDDHVELISATRNKKCITKLVYLRRTGEIWFGTGTSFVFYDYHADEFQELNTPITFVNAVLSPNQNAVVTITHAGLVYTYVYDHIEEVFKNFGHFYVQSRLCGTRNFGWGANEFHHHTDVDLPLPARMLFGYRAVFQIGSGNQFLSPNWFWHLISTYIPHLTFNWDWIVEQLTIFKWKEKLCSHGD